jgi:hypothetical protein
LFKIRKDSGPNRIQVDISDQFLKVGVFLANNGFVSVLKKLAMSPVPTIETNGIPCE